MERAASGCQRADASERVVDDGGGEGGGGGAGQESQGGVNRVEWVAEDELRGCGIEVRGCGVPCGKRLACGHTCARACHPGLECSSTRAVSRAASYLSSSTHLLVAPPAAAQEAEDEAVSLARSRPRACTRLLQRELAKEGGDGGQSGGDKGEMGSEPREKVDELELLEAIAAFWKNVKAGGEGEEDTGHVFRGNAQAWAGERALETVRQEASDTDIGDGVGGDGGEKEEEEIAVKLWQGASGGLREGGEREDTCHSRERMRVCGALTPLPHECENCKAEKEEVVVVVEVEEEEEPADISREDTGHAFWDACETLTPLLCECGLRQVLVQCCVLQTRLRLRLGAPHHTPVSSPIVAASIRPPCNFSCQVSFCLSICPFYLQTLLACFKDWTPKQKDIK